jgi:lysophospholipase L1-like esterase
VRKVIILLSLATAPVGVAPAQAPPAEPIRASKIILVGDSTTAVWGGWGPSFCARHVTSFAACLNLARGGRSSASYRAEGSWEIARGEMRVPGYRDVWVLIQFGHNDQPGKPGRSTDLQRAFPVNIQHYVEEVRAAGAHPVLVTPLTRRNFKNGQLDNDLAPWAAAIRKIAAELDVPLVDLNAESAAAVSAMGPVAADRLAAVAAGEAAAPPAAMETDGELNGPPRQAFDHTHLGSSGADYFATMVTRALVRVVPALRPLLVR